MEDERRSSKVKKGSLAVRVGLEGEDGGFKRFVIPISYLYNPHFRRLLDSAHEVYGYNSSGPLKLPCSVDDFLHLQLLIERESHGSSSHSKIHHQPPSFSLHTC
ncbi:Auxin-responsive protein SAUR32 [Carex littledalei]|uniref:Auxin-responsive protein SAUR32 n=1 Tax=Carex littledalei TaxID=544730 RepID=A0A833QEG3_9POAL|nr:Auxin-responsive protein SAUR32 [Carex littledalei]